MADRDFDRKLGALSNRFATLADQGGEYLLEATANIGRATAARAKSLTPRSDGPGPHIADGWRADVKFSPGEVDVKVHNVEPRANEPLPLKSGGSTTLLRILEFGSRPHVIEAKPGKRLVFFWPKVGKVVYAQRVEHPGTRPYSMMTLASTEAAIATKRTADALRTVIRLALQGKAGRLRAPNPFGA